MSARTTTLAILLVILLGVLPGGVGCPKKPVDTAPPPPTEPARPAEPPPPPPPPPKPEPPKETFPTEPIAQPEPTISELNARGVLKTIYFAYDKSDLDDAARATLQQNAAWLKANLRYRVRLEGHCDERGTIEYNLALGQRRAHAAREYLATLGVDASRIRAVSFGEERPALPGSGDSVWAKNRRGESFVEE